jgi:hypothetical protein
MDCNIFRKRINDLLEDNLSYDLREAMLEHIKGCEVCSALYKEELEIDEMFMAGLSADTQNFRSLRSDIMKNIDKNRYGGSTAKRLFKHFKNYIATYTSLVAVIAVFVFLVPYVKAHGLLNTTKAINMPEAKSSTQNSSISTKSKGTEDNALGIADNNSTKQAVMNALDDNKAKNNVDTLYTPKFEKKTLDKNINAKFNTPLKISLNKKYSATVEGKGTEAQEEGIGSIILKDLNSGNQWSFSLVDNQRQYSPKAVEWVDDENVLVIVGFGYGMVNQGGGIYLLNINTALAAKADPENTAKLDYKSEITKIQSVKMQETNMLSVEVEVLVYEDSSLNKNHRENRIITSSFSDIAKNIKQ